MDAVVKFVKGVCDMVTAMIVTVLTLIGTFTVTAAVVVTLMQGKVWWTHVSIPVNTFVITVVLP